MSISDVFFFNSFLTKLKFQVGIHIKAKPNFSSDLFVKFALTHAICHHVHSVSKSKSSQKFNFLNPI